MAEDVNYGDVADTSAQELAQEFFSLTPPTESATLEKDLQGISEEDLKAAETPELPKELGGEEIKEDPAIPVEVKHDAV